MREKQGGSANAVTEDWNVLHTPDLVTQWLRLGYTTDLMASAGQQIIDATMNAFPLAVCTMAVGGNGNQLDGPGGNQVLARRLIDEARLRWPTRTMVMQKNDLSVCITAAPGTGSLSTR